MKHLFYKILFKIVELFLNLFTFFKYFFTSDKTKLLLKFRPAQIEQIENERRNKPELSLQNQSILIVIPFRDKWNLTETCLQSLAMQKYENLKIHVVLVDNNSSEEETQKGLDESIIKYKNTFATLKIEQMPIPFNFSRLNNQAVYNFTESPIDIVFFLNNDIEFVTEFDLKNLVSFFVNTNDIGALGCTLIYPQESEEKIIQHSFVAPGMKIVGAHPLKGYALHMDNLWFLAPRAVPAVTGAVFLVYYSDFIKTSGFDEQLPTAYQDVDLCLKLQQINKMNWTLTTTVLVHHESATRRKKIIKNEVKYMYEKWGNILIQDAFFSKKISSWSEKPTEALFEGNYPWWHIL
jgi:GT2 family glycosyltransferase